MQLDDAVETVELEDLADGETRELAAGDHRVAVTRTGDRLSVLLDGKELMADLPGADGLETMLWVEDGEAGVEKVVVMKGADAGSSELRTFTVRTRTEGGSEEIDVEVEAIAEGDSAALEQLHASRHEGTMIFTSAEPGAHPIVVAGPGVRAGMVRYRCAETGSELLVPEDAALSDSYVCPATGCVMARVDEPEVHVIKVMKRRSGADPGVE